MFKNLLNRFRKERGTGANIDTRPESKKLKDYKFEEIVATINPVNWIEKNSSTWRKFPIFDQNGSGSCVAQSVVKLLGIMYWLKNNAYVHFSATHVYQRRSNKPKAGMAGVDALDIAREGVTLEELTPSQKMTDAQMDSIDIPEYKKRVGEVFKIENYIVLPIKDIDTVASVIQTTKKGVMVWFYFRRDEWTDHPVVKDLGLPESGPETARHSITAVDYCLVNGKKALISDDSWGSSYGIVGQRVIDEDFFKARNLFAAYPMSFKFEEIVQPSPSPKPHYNFVKPLEFGQRSPDIVKLQEILKYEGLFPLNVTATGYYGAITAKAVMGFQIKYSVASSEELQSLQGRRVGAKTLIKLNQLYSS